MNKTDKVLNGLEQCLMSDDLEAWEMQCAECPYCEGRRNHNECKEELLDDALALIREQQKQLKAQTPVKHGRWIDTENNSSISGYCSSCGWKAHMYEDDVIGMPYCPNCGARMNGGNA